MRDTATKIKARMRPMTKTHKIIEAAVLQLFPPEKLATLSAAEFLETSAITVSTIGEAKFYADMDFADILYPYPPTVDKLRLIRDCLLNASTNHPHLKRVCLSIDNAEVLGGVIEFAKQNNLHFDVYLDIDPTEYRTGLDPNDATSVEVARRIVDSGVLRLIGLYVHGGHSYVAGGSAQVEAVAVQEIETIVKFKAKLASLGIEAPVLAVGSTPTAVKYDRINMTEITELHPGNYTLYDAHQCAIGSCLPHQIASTILARVMSKYSFPHNRLLLDAGAFALSKDRGATHLGDELSFGTIVGHPELRISEVSQEVSVVEARKGHVLDLSKFAVGSLLQIVPNHSCLSCYCYDNVHVVNERMEVIDVWKTCPRHSSSSSSSSSSSQ